MGIGHWTLSGHEFSVAGKRVVVVGAARSGIAAAELLVRRGARVTLSEMRESFDLKIFLDPEPNLRLAWKVCRDSAQRGARAADVHAALADRAADASVVVMRADRRTSGGYGDVRSPERPFRGRRAREYAAD